MGGVATKKEEEEAVIIMAKMECSKVPLQSRASIKLTPKREKREGRKKGRTSCELRSTPTENFPENLEGINLFFYLYHPHGQPSLLCQLLPDVPRWLGRLAERGLEHLQLLGLYGRPRSPPLVGPSAVVDVAPRPSSSSAPTTLPLLRLV